MGRDKKYIDKHLLDFIRKHPLCSIQQLLDTVKETASRATVKRNLQSLIAQNLIVSHGKLKGTKYEINNHFVAEPLNTDAYFKTEFDKRNIKEQFDHELIQNTLSNVALFTNEELQHLSALQDGFKKNSSEFTPAEFKKSMEHLAIDLSWKSSQIEGNTYSLLETEILLKDKKTAAGKTKDDAVMLLNHKDVLDILIAEPNYVNRLTVAIIESLHSVLIKELGVSRNVRKRQVSISGTNYKPLDNEFQIREALEDMCKLVNQKENVFEKALLVLLLISYIQPFTDGNKRTARIVSNAILMNNNYCPLSFRTVDPADYKKAMLIFYEQNNIHAVKTIFIEQFEFAVKTYF